MGYTINELNSKINDAKKIIEKCDKVIAACDNIQGAIDLTLKRIATSDDNSILGLNMLNDTFSQSVFDEYDTSLLLSYAGFKKAYDSGENPYAFYDDLINCRKNITESRNALVAEFARMQTVVENYNSLNGSIKSGVSTKKSELETSIKGWESEIESIREAERKKKASNNNDNNSDNSNDDSSEGLTGSGAGHSF